MKLTPEIAEIAGAFAADGSMQEEHLCMWGNITEDREYYDKELGPLYEETFGVDLNIHEKTSNSVYGFNVCTPWVLEYFWNELEFTPGPKTYTVRVPKIIRESSDPEIWAAFIRGYVDCDGSLSFGKRYGNSYKEIRTILHMNPIISANCVSEQLIRDVSVLLKRLGIKHTTHTSMPKNPRYHQRWRVQIAGKKRYRKWMQMIGFSNHAKITKCQVYAIHGFCPPHTTIQQRRQILNGRQCPLSYYTAP